MAEQFLEDILKESMNDNNINEADYKKKLYEMFQDNSDRTNSVLPNPTQVQQHEKIQLPNQIPSPNSIQSSNLESITNEQCSMPVLKLKYDPITKLMTYEENIPSTSSEVMEAVSESPEVTTTQLDQVNSSDGAARAAGNEVTNPIIEILDDDPQSVNSLFCKICSIDLSTPNRLRRHLTTKAHAEAAEKARKGLAGIPKRSYTKRFSVKPDLIPRVMNDESQVTRMQSNQIIRPKIAQGTSRQFTAMDQQVPQMKNNCSVPMNSGMGSFYNDRHQQPQNLVFPSPNRQNFINPYARFPQFPMNMQSMNYALQMQARFFSQWPQMQLPQLGSPRSNSPRSQTPSPGPNSQLSQIPSPGPSSHRPQTQSPGPSSQRPQTPSPGHSRLSQTQLQNSRISSTSTKQLVNQWLKTLPPSPYFKGSVNNQSKAVNLPGTSNQLTQIQPQSLSATQRPQALNPGISNQLLQMMVQNSYFQGLSPSQRPQFLAIPNNQLAQIQQQLQLQQQPQPQNVRLPGNYGEPVPNNPIDQLVIPLEQQSLDPTKQFCNVCNKPFNRKCHLAHYRKESFE